MNCLRHPDRASVTSFYDAHLNWERRYMCKECADAMPGFCYDRAFATGIGSEAHREAQESGRYQQDFDNAKPYSTERRYL